VISKFGTDIEIPTETDIRLVSKVEPSKSSTPPMKREPYLGRAELVRRASQNSKCHPFSPNDSFSSPPKSTNSAHCQIVPLEFAEVTPVLLILMNGKSAPNSQNQLFSSDSELASPFPLT
jgi:hypothetical protein